MSPVSQREGRRATRAGTLQAWRRSSTRHGRRSAAGAPPGTGAQTTDSSTIQLRAPAELGGEGGGTNPEQLFAVGFAACFEGAIGVMGRRERAEVGDVSIDSSVTLTPTEERSMRLGVELDVSLPQVAEDELAEKIVRGAHQVCPYSNATRGNVDVRLRVNGRPLD
jgi:osmotically inducible protein OsmC